VRLGSYELFRRGTPLSEQIQDKMMHGLSTRNYEAVVRDFSKAHGIEKSAVSEHFIEAGRGKVKELMERPPGRFRFCAVLIDGTPFRDRQMIVALGIGCDGKNTVPGLREGATGNLAPVNALLGELMERGLDFAVPRLYILDGGKALHSAVKRKLDRAYSTIHCAEAKQALERLHVEIMHLNPGAARSLEEGMEETLTVHRLHTPHRIRRTLSSTNVIESAFSVVETVCRNVKRRRDGAQIERWVRSGLLVAEMKFRRLPQDCCHSLPFRGCGHSSRSTLRCVS
jgi:transposase-like protein